MQQRRNAAGLQKTALVRMANATGLSQRYLSFIEDGWKPIGAGPDRTWSEVNPSAGVVIAIAHVLNWDPKEALELAGHDPAAADHIPAPEAVSDTLRAAWTRLGSEERAVLEQLAGMLARTSDPEHQRTPDERGIWIPPSSGVLDHGRRKDADD